MCVCARVYFIKVFYFIKYLRVLTMDVDKIYFPYLPNFESIKKNNPRPICSGQVF